MTERYIWTCYGPNKGIKTTDTFLALLINAKLLDLSVIMHLTIGLTDILVIE